MTKNIIITFSLFFCVLSAQIPKIFINEFLASNAHINYDPDYKDYSDWFELYNAESFPINLNGYFLTDDILNPTKWQITEDITIESNGYIIFWADNEKNGSHTDFQLNVDGEDIGIYMPDGSVVDEISFQTQQTDISYGRNPTNMDEWLYYSIPTPDQLNETSGLASPVSTSNPIFSVTSGFYTNELSLEIIAELGADIRYTINGSEPNENSIKYTEPINIYDRTSEPNYFSEIPTNYEDISQWIHIWQPPIGLMAKATIIRAKSFAKDKLPSKIVTNSFFIGPDLKDKYNTIPVISLVSDEKHLFSDESGIYVPGNTQRNFLHDWKRPAHIQFFDENGTLKISQEFEIKPQGTTSPFSPLKGLHVIARNKYGNNSIDYPLFKNGKSKANKLTSFKRIILRGWGSVLNHGMVNDALAQTSYANSALDIQEYRPVIVFINGEYWGLEEIREANRNPYYFQEHYGVDKDDPGIDLLLGGKNEYYIDEGDTDHWEDLVDFINNNDISNHENYGYLKTQMDVDNFIDYIGHCIYFGKGDWPNNNEAFWRPKTVDGRWRWIQFDMDFSSWINSNTETLPNHDLLEELLINQYFKNKYINWYLDRINSHFISDIVHNNYNNILNEIYPYWDEHQKRWVLSYSNFGTFTIWVRDFITKRPGLIKSLLRSKYNLGNLNTITLDTDEGGTIKINSLMLDDNTPRLSENTYPWSGQYFEDVPIVLTAIPNEGFIFDHWEGTIESQTESIELYLTQNSQLKAIFSPIKIIDSIYINEISTDNTNIIRNDSGKYEDWIELYNSSEDTLSISGLYLTDDFTNPTKWKFPQDNGVSFNITPKEYKIIWCDKEPTSGVDHVDFSLSKSGEQIGLVQISNKDTVFIDSLTFSKQLQNITYGRYPDAGNKWELLILPTPGKPNILMPVKSDELNGTQIFQNYPNPFKIITRIPFYLSQKGDIEIDIYNLNGDLIRRMVANDNPIGYNEILWDGRDRFGSPVSSGIYFYRMKTDEINQVKKMLFLK